MSQNVLMQPTKNEPRRGLSWLHVLFTGIVLFIVSTVVMFLTNNPNLFPTVILIGNFLVPVVFVAFLYDHQHLSSFTPETIARSSSWVVYWVCWEPQYSNLCCSPC